MANRVTRWSGTDRRRLRLTRRGRVALSLLVASAAVGGALAVRGLTAGLPVATDPAGAAAPAPTPPPSPPPPVWAAPTLVAEPAPWPLASTPAEAAVAAARGLFTRAPVAVVVPAPDDEPTDEPSDAPVDADALLSGWLAVRLQAPLLHVGPGLPDLLEQLGTRTAVTVGLDAAERRTVAGAVPDVRAAVVAAADRAIVPLGDDVRPDPAAAGAAAARRGPALALRSLDGPPVTAWLAEVRTLLGRAARVPAADRPGVALVARASDPASWAVSATAAAADVPTVALAGPDPRAKAGAVEQLAGRSVTLVAGTTDAWGDTDPVTLTWQLETAATGVQLPGGGQTLFPGKLLVALYGHPDGGALGVLGEQPVGQAVVRAEELAEHYRAFAAETVVPTFEIIATVASRSPGERGDYSRRTPVATLRPWVDAAREAGVYVLLDLQPGRTSFLDQAQEYEELLREPHVGLALDPEWRLAPDQVHLRQIGSVHATEVNAVAKWLALLVRTHRLPQKAFVVHQFKLSMIADRPSLALGHAELAAIVHVDGQGGQAAKDETYRNVTGLAPPTHVWWGWKNFYDEDVPAIRSPEATYAVEPRPVMISYQ